MTTITARLCAALSKEILFFADVPETSRCLSVIVFFTQESRNSSLKYLLKLPAGE